MSSAFSALFCYISFTESQNSRIMLQSSSFPSPVFDENRMTAASEGMISFVRSSSYFFFLCAYYRGKEFFTQGEMTAYMKATGIVRRIDDLGRVVIPKEIRRTLRIRESDPSQTTLANW